MNYKLIMEEMIEKKLSIREMALKLGISKSKLHYHLKKVKEKIQDDFLLVDFDTLMTQNKDNMAFKGAKNRWSKKTLEK